jgi:hypothetical protein
MGQAKARGTYEQRKAAAIEEGRIKRQLALWHYVERVNAFGTRYMEPTIIRPGRIVSQHLLGNTVQNAGPVQQ